MINLFPRGIFLFDNLSLFFLAVIALVSIPSALFSGAYLQGECSRKRFILSSLVLAVFIFSMCMVVVSGNLFSFLIFWELMAVSSYFLVVFDYRHQKPVRAGTIYLVMTHIGTAAIMAAFFILYTQAGSFDFGAVKQAALVMPGRMRDIVFLLLLFGFAAKAGAVPLHIWLPYAHPQAPSHVSSIMSGVMIKTAVYAMIRFFIMLLGGGSSWWGSLILAIGIISCLAGITYALMDNDIKRLLAYSSVENMGIILLGVGSAMFIADKQIMPLAVLGMFAGLYHLINHALLKGLLFLCAGSIVKATGMRDIEKMGGLIKVMPWTAGFFLIAAMGISALPPLNGFVSEWLMFQSFFIGAVELAGWGKMFMVIGGASLALTSGLVAACFIKAFGITFLALPRSISAKEAREVPLSMRLSMGFLAAAVILFGIGAGFIGPFIWQVAQDVFGAHNLVFSFPWFSLKIPFTEGVSISPFIIAIVLFILSFIILRWFILNPSVKKVQYNTWDCGYYNLDSRNEYTATAFSKPFRIAFSFFLMPYRRSEKIRDSFYHVRSFTYETHTTVIFKRYFYDFLLRLIYRSAFKLRKLQPGSINLYILYIFLTMIGLIVVAGVLK